MAGRLVINMAGILFIISAPSGSGKSTLVSEVRRLVEGLEFSISYTTRQPRGSEENGKEYWFTNHAEFERMIDEGEFLEWAKVFGSNYYGTAVSALEHARTHGHDLLLDIDVQGALQVMKKVPEAVSIFILPPSPQVLEMRLRNRSQAEGVTDEAVIEERLSQARNELRHLSDYKYALINDQLDQAASEMRAIVLHQRGEEGEVAETAARCLTSAHSARLDAALTSFQVSTTIV
ncbi:guanylate kinase [Granulicella mallensis]|jgi:guanylate kinase|uniref:Guanylate kinase n=1 Tax=Granulicella mallensis TaxID=940614 RepID=A0A7W7ZVH3_9BACT|nr:guanylate kinase [Granulicella mallensis]MBB5066538.1 guanylate kinase [Granulicella mallensis]